MTSFRVGRGHLGDEAVSALSRLSAPFIHCSESDRALQLRMGT